MAYQGNRHRMLRIVFLTCLALLVSSIAWVSAAGKEEQKTVVVELVGMKFNPEQIKIEPGTKVIFINKDPYDHNVIHATANNLKKVLGKSTLFESPTLKFNQKFEFVFEHEGTFPILCNLGGHYLAGMVGKVIVGKGGKVDDGFALAKKLLEEKKK